MTMKSPFAMGGFFLCKMLIQIDFFVFYFTLMDFYATIYLHKSSTKFTKGEKLCLENATTQKKLLN